MSSHPRDVSGRETSVELVIGAMTRTLSFKAAAVALERLPPDEEAAATVVAAYQQGRVDPWLAALLIGAIRHEHGYPTALAILRRGAGQLSESYAGPAMAKIRGVEAFDDLAAVLREPGLERRVYEGAAYGLGQVADPRALPLVIDACMQERVGMDTAGAIAADCASEAALLGYLASPEPRYQRLALHAFFFWSASRLPPPSRAARDAVLHALARPECASFPGRLRAMLEQRFGHGVSSRRSASRSSGPPWDLPTPAALWALVDDQLREGAWDLRPRPGGHPIHDDRSEPESFDEYRAQVIRRLEQRHERRLEELRDPPHRHLIRIASRQYGSGDALDGKPVERKLADDLFLALQSHRARYITAETWRREIAALDRADAWLALAAQHETAGRLLQSNAALATAHWLDPATAGSAADIVRDRRTESLPDCLLEQPQPGFRARRLGDRHWRAWAMQHGAVDLPSLIAYACDENFSVRARIYRSLGQQSLVAAVPVLRDALHDPDDFARAQAVRSLGWIGEPTSFERLLRLAGEDPSAEVRRSALLACQRIAGYWRFYGEWRTIVRSPRLFDVARALASDGLGGYANDLVEWQLCDAMSSDDHDAIRAELEPFSLAGDRAELARRYDYHFAAASELEGAIARADPEHEPDLMLALYAASKQHVMPARIADLVTAPEPLGWNARRALRALRLTE
jgi:HEAT repeat protein